MNLRELKVIKSKLDKITKEMAVKRDELRELLYELEEWDSLADGVVENLEIAFGEIDYAVEQISEKV